MSPQRLTGDLVRDTPLLREDATVEQALEALRATDLPAVPVVDGRDRLVGIFGEREFMEALFPAYLQELHSARFVPRSLDDALEKRSVCRQESVGRHLNRENISVPRDYSDSRVAETFLHHRTLLLPVVDDRRVVGVITRHDFFERLAERLLSGSR